MASNTQNVSTPQRSNTAPKQSMLANHVVQVVRYTAILAGVIYGFSHAGTLQAKHNEESVRTPAAAWTPSCPRARANGNVVLLTICLLPCQSPTTEPI